jgi:hypothetical protein
MRGPEISSSDLQKALEGELKALRITGVAAMKVGGLPELRWIAEAQIAAGDDAERIEKLLQLGISRFEPDRPAPAARNRDAAIRWFGLHEDTRELDQQARHDAAAKATGRGMTTATFQNYWAPKYIQGLAYVIAHIGAMEPPDQEESSPPSGQVELPPSEQDTEKAKWRQSLSPMQLGLVSMLLLLALAGALMLLGDSQHSDAIPPQGTVVDAQTGEVAQRVTRQPNRQGTYISGGSLFRACNLATEDPCQYSPNVQPQVWDGDVIRFGIRLHNPNEVPLPYTTLVMNRAAMGSSAPPYTYIQANLTIDWPEDRKMPTAPIREELKLPSPVQGYASLAYIPGSTVLEDEDSKFLAHLPDGIMEEGIALANLGSPASCFSCDMEYVRFVFFKARVGVNPYGKQP